MTKTLNATSKPVFVPLVFKSSTIRLGMSRFATNWPSLHGQRSAAARVAPKELL